MATDARTATISRRKLIATMLGAAVGTSPLFVSASEKQIEVSMIADLGCSHCSKAYTAMVNHIHAMKAKGIGFNFEPILPANISDEDITPKPVVRFFYAVKKTATQSEVISLPLHLFKGMEEGALLDDFDSVYQWVMLQGLKLDYEKTKSAYDTYGMQAMFEDALIKFKRLQGDYVPMFALFEDGEMKTVWRWAGDVETSITPVIDFVKSYKP